MRILIISLTVSLFFAGANSANAAIPVTPSSDTTYTFKTPHHKPLYEKGKGTIGFLCGFFLGPVGWLGVHVFSHNRTQRKQATHGMEALGALILIVGILYLCAKDGNVPNFNFSSNHHQRGPRKPAAVHNGLTSLKPIPQVPVTAAAPGPQTVLSLIH